MKPKPYLRAFLVLLWLLAFPASTFAFSGTGSGTEPDPYVITNVEQLQEVQDDLGAYYVLGNDIDASDTVNWNGDQGFVPIGNNSNSFFTGKFDGQGYTITGMYINRPSTNSIALFRGTAGAEIKNVGMADVDITGSMSVGALVNYNDENSIIRNCWSSGNVRSTYVGANTGGIGGLVGSNADGSLISQCYSNTNVTGNNARQYGGLVGRNIRGSIIEDCYATGDVSGGGKVGGLVGDNMHGSQGGYVARCYSTGQVTGSGGGLIGYNYNGGVTYDSYWDTETSGKTSSYGGTGKSTGQMKQQATFVNWDFADVWDIIEDETYPFLREVQPPQTGPVAHWKFDEGAGDIAYDSAGDNDGVVYGATWTTGKIGDFALDFDGEGDYVDCGDSSDLELSTGAISVWVNLNETSDDQVIYCKGKNNTNKGGIFIEAVEGYVVAGLKKTNTWRVFIETPISSNEWTHLVFTFGSEGAAFYKNGLSVGTDPDTTGFDHIMAAHVLLGVRDNGARILGFCNGVIDDVRIYNDALSGEEIQQLYQGGAGDVIALEIIGPDEVAENFTANYKAIAYYDNNETKDVTPSVLWAVEPNTYADIDDNGVLTTKDISEDQLVVILADYAVGNTIFEAEKVVDIFPICPTGTALSFDGVDDYVNCGNDASFDFGAGVDFTVTAWIKTSAMHHIRVVDKQYAGTYPYEGFLLQLSQGMAAFRIVDVSYNKAYAWGVTNIADDKWHFLAGVAKRNGNVELYVDTGLEAFSSMSHVGNINSNMALAIGRSMDYDEQYFDGTIDDVRIYNRALSAEEIWGNMHARMTGDEPGLVGYWDFDEGEGQTVYDLSGNGNDGQLGSTPNPDTGDPTWIESDAPVGLCTPYLITKTAISRAIKHKLASLEELQAALEQEAISIDALDEFIKSGDFGNLKRRHLLTAKHAIYRAILAEKLCHRKLNRTMRDLKIALAALDGKVPPPGWPKLDMEIDLEMADVSADGVVDFRDFAMLSSQWLKSYQPKK